MSRWSGESFIHYMNGLTLTDGTYLKYKWLQMYTSMSFFFSQFIKKRATSPLAVAKGGAAALSSLWIH